MDTIEKLLNGYRRFREGPFEALPTEYRTLVEEGQNPDVAVLTCSDSRLNVSMMFQSTLGQIFLIRNVANQVPPFEGGEQYHGTSAALEYAVEFLQVGHVIVMGHSHCGGVRASMDDSAALREAGPFVSRWVALLRPAYERMRETHADAPRAEQERACEQYGVLNSLENLRTFPFIRKRLQQNVLHLHGWHFNILTGGLEIYDDGKGAFVPA